MRSAEQEHAGMSCGASCANRVGSEPATSPGWPYGRRAPNPGLEMTLRDTGLVRQAEWLTVFNASAVERRGIVLLDGKEKPSRLARLGPTINRVCAA
jgi:hypothetical protein